MRPNKIVTLHGESVILFAVVSYSLYDEADWDVVATFRDRQKAERLYAMLLKEQEENAKCK